MWGHEPLNAFAPAGHRQRAEAASPAGEPDGQPLTGPVATVRAMGLFEEAGRRFERFKRQAESAAAEETGYECAACDVRLSVSRDHCPECGADEVVPVGREDGDEQGSA